MTRHEGQTQAAASTNTEVSITMPMQYKTDLTFTTEFKLEVDLNHPASRVEINRIIGKDDLASACARLLELSDLAADPKSWTDPTAKSSPMEILSSWSI